MKQVKVSLLFSLILTTGLSTIAIAARFNPITTRGMNVLSRSVVLAYGGVVLQGTTEFRDSSGKIVSPRNLQLQLNAQLDKNEQICIVYRKTCYGIEISSQNAIPLATWVFSGQTGAFTAFTNQEEAEEGSLREVEEGYAPAELTKGTIPQILAFIDLNDYSSGLLSEFFNDSQIRAKYNKRLGSGFDPKSYQSEKDSYIWTDIDTKYKAQLINKQVQSTGLINKYYWQLYQGVQYPYIKRVERACTPESIKATNNKYCSLVSYFTPQEVESLYQKQKEALLLTQTTAIFRTFADDNCEELRRFVKAHSQNYKFPPNQCDKLRELAKEAKS
ncbi:MAG: hypothetical protein RMZ43_000120 [Nostoc sp. CmiVER01]|uniref:hypothetical protein n=1 Tax=Nostoc sp. CmiVER01 TaxID=3075384 RepID=UPI002AD3382C|nr:hypothetical protein [Nostoc sp. CmiVER01]MDZ8121877.1 hypothetical protein [Nostoc sp. CmiVER01]